MRENQTAQSGSVLGAALLISGCCIGAGMLGLPVMSALAGFKPSLLMFLLSWLFMLSTALLLLEVTLWFNDDVNIVSMAERTLGFIGKWAGWLCFLFLFYALGVAYIAGSGELLSAFVQAHFDTKPPQWIGSIAVALLFGGFVYLGTRPVDLFNRLLMLGLAGSYLLLIVLGAPHVKAEYLKHEKWPLAVLTLPVMIISFGFHNLIPSLTTYLKRDAKRLRLSIICGSAIPLGIYLLWEWLILGLVPIHDKEGFIEAIEKGNMATEILKNASSASFVLDTAHYFAFFAILTSFLGNSLSFVDFLADGLQIVKNQRNKLLLCLAVIAPSLLLACAYPHIFLTALNYAGAFGAVILFGILPALMAWSGRYRKKFSENKPLVPGGKLTLLLLILFALGVIGLQFLELSNP